MIISYLRTILHVMTMNPPRIPLPWQFNGPNISNVVASLNSTITTLPKDIIFDFSPLGFIDPCGVVFLSNLIHWLRERGCNPTFDGIDINRAPIKFLEDSLFFEQHIGKKLDPSSSPRSTTRPLQLIPHEKSHSWLETNLVPWLANRLSLTEASLYSFKASISELFNNIQDHANLEIGSIFVQHFPKKNTINLAIADFGPGIPSSVRKKVPNLTDSDAIQRAVEEGFTTLSRPSNRGAGLSYLLDVVAKTNGGSVTIYSNHGIVRFVAPQRAIVPVVIPHNGFCPGTTIEIELRTDTIQQLPDEREELEWF